MSETAALKKPFLIGLLATAIGFLVVGGFIAILASNTDDRPEGVAERWLTAVGDLTRKGVHDDAAKRISAHGDASLADPLLKDVKADGKSAFTSLEVGKARRVDAETVLVPAKLVGRGWDTHVSLATGLLMRLDAGSWRVVELRADRTLLVPSDGGPAVAKAPVGLYVVALVIGLGVAVGASTLVRAAGREHELSLLQ